MLKKIKNKNTEYSCNEIQCRLIFDHIPKTAGMAFNSWLEQSIGENLVAHGLVGNYTALKLNCKKKFKVLSAHLDFNGEGLDSDFKHITCLREPVERVLSHIYYILNNFTEELLGELYIHTSEFVSSCGEEIHPMLYSYFSNYYVEHFSRLSPTIFITKQDKIEAALYAISQYDLVGFQSNLLDFQKKVSAILNIDNSNPLKLHNVTLNRPELRNISEKLITRIKAINALDIDFYAEVIKFTNSEGLATKVTLPSSKKFGIRQQDENSFVLLGATGPAVVSSEERMRFDIEFFLPRKLSYLVLGFGIFDVQKQRIFGTNTTLLNQPLKEIGPGKHRISYIFDANLFEGDYFLRISADEIKDSQHITIAKFDQLRRFTVKIQRTQECIGVANLNASISLQKTP